MDVEKKYVFFKNRLEVEFFLTLCEEQGITWPNTDHGPRSFIGKDINNMDRLGYCVHQGKLYDVVINSFTTKPTVYEVGSWPISAYIDFEEFLL